MLADKEPASSTEPARVKWRVRQRSRFLIEIWVMQRRYFLEAAAAALAASGAPARSQPVPPRPKASLKLGTQNDSSDDALRVLAALGVNHICSTLPSARLDENWSAQGSRRLRERVESFGIRLEMVPLPLSSSLHHQIREPQHHAGQESRARPRNRQYLPDDSQCRARRHPGPEIQPDHSGRGAHRAHSRSRRRALQHFRLHQSRRRIRRSPKPAR